MQELTTEIRTYLASAIMLLILVAVLCYMTFIPVPDENEKAIMLILGVLTGAGSAAIPNLFGGGVNKEMEDMKERIRRLENSNSNLEIRYNTVKEEYDRLTDRLIERHVIHAEGIESKKKLNETNRNTTA